MPVFSKIIPHTIVMKDKSAAVKIGDVKPVALKKGEKFFWHHFDLKDKSVVSVLTDKYKLDEDVAEALTDEITRPRYFVHGKGIVFILRGIISGGKSTHLMASLRVWIDGNKIITIATQNVKAIDTVINEVKDGLVFKTSVECFLKIAEKMADDITDVVSEISDKADKLEAEVISIESVRNPHLRASISEARRRIVSIRRYLVPNRDIYTNIKLEKIDLFTAKNRADIREIYNKVMKSVEDLDYARDHLAVSFEELQGKVSVRISQIMYIISIVTVIFMPMGLLTSLLGINVKGIPFADEPNAFLWVAGILLFICMLLIVFLRRIRWI